MDKTIAKFTGSKVLPGDTFNKAYKVVAKMVLHDLGQGAYFSATVDRYADKHGKGQWVDDGGGCDHDAITANFPHLAKYVKWHLVNVGSGPMHYLANTLYHAGDCDYNGLRAGEKRQIVNGRTKLPRWELVAVNAEGVKISSTPTGDKYRESETVPLFILEHNADGENAPEVAPRLEWRPLYRIGEGKDRDLEAARRTAVWPNASDEELSLPREELKAKLIARLTALMAEFEADMLELFGDQVQIVNK